MGSSLGRIRAQRELNSLDKKLARKDAAYIRKAAALSNTKNPNKAKKLAKDIDDINRQRANIESDTWKKIGDTLDKGYDISTSDKLRDGRSHIEKMLVGGFGTAAISAIDASSIKKSGQDFTALYNGRKIQQTPITIVGKRYKLSRREEGNKPTMTMRVKL